MATDAPPEIPPHKNPALSLICEKAEVKGTVQLGANNVLQNYVKLETENDASIVVGRDNIFDDRAVIQSKENELTIGDGNSIGIGCVVEGSMGNHCVLGHRSKILPGATLGDRVTLLPFAIAKGMIPDGAIVAADGTVTVREDVSLANDGKVHLKHIEYLREVLPRYNKTRVM